MNWQKLYNPLMIFILRSPVHGLLDRNTMLITVTGRRSGKSYTAPVNYLTDGNTLLTVSQRHRTWWRNLCGGAPVEVRVKGQTYRALGEACTDDNEVALGLKRYLELAPQIARYIGVGLEPNGQPKCDDLTRAAQERVMVRVHLNNGGMDARNN
jgi:deazaflavin-dependent oxidoreductase (nitroreductase family)